MDNWNERKVYVCPDCGHNEVHALAWVNANTEELLSSLDGTGQSAWCLNCATTGGQHSDGAKNRLVRVPVNATALAYIKQPNRR